MILAVAATEFEMASLSGEFANEMIDRLVCGVGPVESCLSLTRYLQKNHTSIDIVINFGVAGAFIRQQNEQPALLDICLARTEVLGDFGICFPMRIDELSPEFAPEKLFKLDNSLYKRAEEIFAERNIDYSAGNFVTVSCASGFLRRGQILAEKYDGICENMEGAALARACREFSVPFLEVRSISNFVEDRDVSSWCLQEACEKIGRTAAQLILDLGREYEKD